MIQPFVVHGNGTQSQVPVVGRPAQTAQLRLAQVGVKGRTVSVIVSCWCSRGRIGRPCPRWKSPSYVTHYRHRGAILYSLDVIQHLSPNDLDWNSILELIVGRHISLYSLCAFNSSKMTWIFQKLAVKAMNSMLRNNVLIYVFLTKLLLQFEVKCSYNNKQL